MVRVTNAHMVRVTNAHENSLIKRFTTIIHF